jgi:hypothetical protein
MTSLSKTLLGAGMGAGLLALSVLNASAAVVCGGSVCWHSSERHDYPATAGVVVHEDNWRWGPNEHYSWREHEGRGYWHGDRWMTW